MYVQMGYPLTPSAAREFLLMQHQDVKGPRLRARTFRAISDEITYQVEKRAELEGWLPERKDRELTPARIAEELAWKEDRKAVQRPKRGLMALAVSGLPDLPDVSRPTLDEFPDLKRYRVLPALLLTMVILTVITVTVLLPALAISPVSATADAVGGEDSGTSVVTWIARALVIALVVLLLTAGPKKCYEILYEAALHEEILFRLGSENFTPGQRIRSCLQFGFAHIVNLIVAFATLGGLAAVGAVFMWVYQREIKASGDPRRAVATAARFHADYNVAAVSWMMFFSILGMVLSFLV